MNARRAMVVLFPALLSLLLAASAAARVLIVTKRNVSYRHFGSVQKALPALRLTA